MRKHPPRKENRREIEFPSSLRGDVDQIKESALEALRAVFELRVRMRILAEKTVDPRLEEVLIKQYLVPIDEALSRFCEVSFGVKLENDDSAGTRRLKRLIRTISDKKSQPLPETDSYDRAELNGLPTMPDDTHGQQKRPLEVPSQEVDGLVDLMRPTSAGADMNAETIAIPRTRFLGKKIPPGTETPHVERTTRRHPRKKAGK